MKETVFISHSSKDQECAEKVCAFLEASGVPCWIAPRDVTPGRNYGAAIVEAIEECSFFLLILSGSSNNSGQVVREVERAASSNSTIIPFRIEMVAPSKDLEFYVSASHWLDAFAGPFEKHLPALLEAIHRRRPQGEPPQPSRKDEPQFPPKVQPQFPRKEDSVTRLASRKLWLPAAIVVAVAGIAVAAVIVFKTRDVPNPIAEHGSLPADQPAARPKAEPTIPAPPQTPVPVIPNATTAATASPLVNRPQRITANQISEVSASSQLKPQIYFGERKSYEPKLVIDGDEGTAWVGNTGGVGEWIAVRFKSQVSIESVSIYGGYGADVPRYRTNNRVKTLRITFGEGFQKVVELEDQMRMQKFKLPRVVVTDLVKFEILAVFRGTKYDSTPISEIGFNMADSE